jgi:hypothetical protein
MPAHWTLGHHLCVPMAILFYHGTPALFFPSATTSACIWQYCSPMVLPLSSSRARPRRVLASRVSSVGGECAARVVVMVMMLVSYLLGDGIDFEAAAKSPQEDFHRQEHFGRRAIFRVDRRANKTQCTHANAHQQLSAVATTSGGGAGQQQQQRRRRRQMTITATGQSQSPRTRKTPPPPRARTPLHKSSPTHSLTHPLTHSPLPHPLALKHTLKAALVHSLTHTLTHSLPHALTPHSLTHALAHSLRSLTHSLTHSLTQSLT